METTRIQPLQNAEDNPQQLNTYLLPYHKTGSAPLYAFLRKNGRFSGDV